MRSSKPPAVAAWLLEHLTPGDKHEALVGDLLEEFQHGRSARWFWRQVLCAIPASLCHEMRVHWVARAVEFGLAWVWVDFVMFHLLPYLRTQLWVMAFEPHARILWRFVLNPVTDHYPGEPWSVLILLPVLLAAYLSARDFNFLAFVCGLLVGVIAMLAIFPVIGILGKDLFALLASLPQRSIPRMEIGRGYIALPNTISVVAGIWAAQLIKRRSRAAEIPG